MALAARPGPAAELITLSEAARLAGVHRDTVRAWCARGDLPSLRQGARASFASAGATSSGCSKTAPQRPATRPAAAADERRRRPAERIERPRRSCASSPRTGTDALRRLASELSGSDALQPVLEEVLDNSERPVPRGPRRPVAVAPEPEHPLELVASRDFPEAIQRARRAATARFQARRLRGAPDARRSSSSTTPTTRRHAGDARALRGERHRVAVLRARDLPRRRRSRSSCCTTHAVRLDAGRDGARPQLRRHDRDGHRQRPAHGLRGGSRRAAPGDPGPLGAASAASRTCAASARRSWPRPAP